jgi:hypothetical protein
MNGAKDLAHFLMLGMTAQRRVKELPGAVRRVSTTMRHSFKGISEYFRLSLMVC